MLNPRSFHFHLGKKRSRDRGSGSWVRLGTYVNFVPSMGCDTMHYPNNQPVPFSLCGLEHTLPVSPQFFSDTMTKFLYEMCQQAIMVVIFIKANIQSSSPKMMNTATSVACISVDMSHRGNGSLIPIIIKGIFSIVTVDAG